MTRIAPSLTQTLSLFGIAVGKMEILAENLLMKILFTSWDMEQAYVPVKNVKTVTTQDSNNTIKIGQVLVPALPSKLGIHMYMICTMVGFEGDAC